MQGYEVNAVIAVTAVESVVKYSSVSKGIQYNAELTPSPCLYDKPLITSIIAIGYLAVAIPLPNIFILIVMFFPHFWYHKSKANKKEGFISRGCTLFTPPLQDPPLDRILSGYPTRENRIQNMAHSRVILTKVEVFG